MAKLTDEKKAALRALDGEPFVFENEEINAFVERALPHGYSFDPAQFRALPGFFQAPHRKDLQHIDIAMFGCPMDTGAIGLAGTRHGPNAVRGWSRNYGPANEATGKVPFNQCSIIDYGDVEWSASDLQARLADIADVSRTLGQAGVSTLSCGGEHTTTFGVLKGLSEAYDNEAFGLVHIDAHCDTMASWGGDAVNDGSVFRQAAINGYIDPERTVQIGIRGRSEFLWEFSRASGMTVISADEVFEKGTAWVIDKAKEIVGPGPSYFSLDADSLDTTIMMGTTGPEPFGLSARQVRDIILGVRGLDFVGADLVELNPNRDPNEQSTHIAAALFFELLCLLADARQQSPSGDNLTTW